MHMHSLGNGLKLWNVIICQQSPLKTNTLNVVFPSFKEEHPIIYNCVMHNVVTSWTEIFSDQLQCKVHV